VRRSAHRARIAAGLIDGCSDRQVWVEALRGARGNHRVCGNLRPSVRSILEAHRARQAACQLAMALALGGARADGAPADQVVDVDLPAQGGSRLFELHAHQDDQVALAVVVAIGGHRAVPAEQHHINRQGLLTWAGAQAQAVSIQALGRRVRRKGKPPGQCRARLSHRRRGLPP